MEDFIYELEKIFGWDPIPEDFVEVDYDDPMFFEDDEDDWDDEVSDDFPLYLEYDEDY